MADDVKSRTSLISETLVKKDDIVREDLKGINNGLNDYIFKKAKEYDIDEDELKNVPEDLLEDTFISMATDKGKSVAEIKGGITEAENKIEEERKLLVDRFETAVELANKSYAAIEEKLSFLFEEYKNDLAKADELLEKKENAKSILEEVEKESEKNETEINELNTRINDIKNKLIGLADKLSKGGSLTEDEIKEQSDLSKEFSDLNGQLSELKKSKVDIDNSKKNAKKDIDDCDKQLSAFGNLDKRKKDIEELYSSYIDSRKKDTELINSLKKDLLENGIPVKGEIADTSFAIDLNGKAKEPENDKDLEGADDPIVPPEEIDGKKIDPTAPDKDAIAKAVEAVKAAKTVPTIPTAPSGSTPELDNKGEKQLPVLSDPKSAIVKYSKMSQDERLSNHDKLLPGLISAKNNNVKFNRFFGKPKYDALTTDLDVVNKKNENAFKEDHSDFDSTIETAFGEDSKDIMSKIFDLSRAYHISTIYSDMKPELRTEVNEVLKKYYAGEFKSDSKVQSNIERFIVNPTKVAAESGLINYYSNGGKFVPTEFNSSEKKYLDGILQEKRRKEKDVSDEFNELIDIFDSEKSKTKSHSDGFESSTKGSKTDPEKDTDYKKRVVEKSVEKDMR